MSDPLRYRSAGVDIDASDSAKDRIKAVVESTFTRGVVGAFGGFGGMFKVPGDIPNPILVSSADGVGTKIKVAIEAGRHDTIGHDLVNHCTNDILAQGASPLFFLDYVAFGKLDPIVVEQVVRGVARGCHENECALIGGETAEMPGLYTPPDYDLAGFVVGCVSEDNVLGSHRVMAGDVLIGLESSGLHTNGYSLARKIVAERLKLGADSPFPDTDGSVSDVLLTIHRSYLGAIRPVVKQVHAIAHITGGGLPGNMNRMLPAGLDCVVDMASWEIPSVFRVLEEAGGVPRDEMFRAFNMGVGMVVATEKAQVGAILTAAARANVRGWVLGEVRPGAGNVILT
ncbi:MAG: phosphoribosylformylglycinamidine cyclo-ligase [Gemmatimonadaceae bacterium]|nr:phosphoribosylformylglycinamidine cyclo-ligase [Gemmatimonadaceae bacterium]